MKKTVIVNINGIIFHIDEDAYERLQAYLDALRHYFGPNPEAKEIIEDIEARISELFEPRVSEAKQSLNIQDVEEVIEVLGKPEDIAGANDENSESEYKSSRKTSRRLHRDPDHALLGGVCSGLASYFAIDPVIFRLLFIALLFPGGVSLIIYIILWIAVPLARTTAQKLEMRGENVTISNIERTFRQEYQHVKKNIDRLHPESIWINFRNFLNEVFILLGNFLRVVWSVFRFIFGFILIIISLGFVAGMVSALYFSFNNFMSDEVVGENVGSLRDFLNYVISPDSADTLLILAIIIVSLFIAALIYAGLKLMIRFKANDRWVILSLAIGWIIAVASFIFLLFGEISNFKIHRETSEIVNIANPHGDVLYVNSPSPFSNDDDKIRRLHHQLFDIKTVGNNKEMYGLIKIDIEKSNSSVPELKIIREANGKTHDEALEALKQIIINYKQNDSVLNIDPIYRLKNDLHWKGYFAKVVLCLPIGTKVYLNENTKYLLNNIENSDDYWNRDMAGKTWTMTADGLSKVEDKNKQQN